MLSPLVPSSPRTSAHGMLPPTFKTGLPSSINSSSWACPEACEIKPADNINHYRPVLVITGEELVSRCGVWEEIRRP